MKTERLKRGDEGYPGSIAESIRLDATETRAIRKVLAKAGEEALHISQIHKAAGIAPHKLGQVSQFVSDYLQHTTREVQMVYSTDGRKTFQGWKMSDHGRDLFEHVG
jgi:hypothetical protein